jgi:hypothetical protein
MNRLTGIYIFVIIGFACLPATALPQGVKSKLTSELFKVGTRMLSGAAAAEGMRRAGNAYTDYSDSQARAAQLAAEAERARSEIQAARLGMEEQIRDFRRRAQEHLESYEKSRRSQIDGVTQQLVSQGSSPDDDTIYSLYLNIDYNVGSVYWADTFSNPDVFFAVEVEGVGDFVLPLIRHEYKGGPLLDRVVTRQLRPGTRVVARVLDDDTLYDTVWNTILRTRINYRASYESTDLQLTKLKQSKIDAWGNITVLDTKEKVVITGPDQIAAVVFSVPVGDERIWTAEGQLKDSYNRLVGQIQFSQIWSKSAELAALQQEIDTLRMQYDRELAAMTNRNTAQIEAMKKGSQASSKSQGNGQGSDQTGPLGLALFWSTVAGLGLVWYLRSYRRPSKTPTAGPQEPRGDTKSI